MRYLRLAVTWSRKLRAPSLKFTFTLKSRFPLERPLEAARIRLRPVLMTSFAFLFLLGVILLVLATGAGQVGRHAVGTTVFGGMIMSTTLNRLIIPVRYMIVEGWREASSVKVERR